jgi:hypothetical protein
MFILCFAGCRGVKVSTAVETKYRDSTVLHEIRATEYAEIPSEKVELKISLKDIAQLPVGAGYSNREGRAGLNITVINDTIYVNAVCDSLRRELERYESRLQYARQETETFIKIEKKNAVQTAFKWCLIGVLAGSIITILISKSLKK